MYLISIESDDFERAELHKIKAGKDIIVSTSASEISTNNALMLAAMGGSVKLAYGGNYLLLLAPKKIITNGTETKLTLRYQVEGSNEKITQKLVFPITSSGIGCGVIPTSEESATPTLPNGIAK